jgi:hypothetical protein
MIITYLLTKLFSPLQRTLCSLVCLSLFILPLCISTSVCVCLLFRYEGSVLLYMRAHPVKTDQYSTTPLFILWQIALSLVSTPWYIVQFRSSANTHTDSGDQSDGASSSFSKVNTINTVVTLNANVVILCLLRHEKSNSRNFLLPDMFI